ncbi:hypothetical protein GGI12_002925 [Dipsacomyces acuminosporus]|nr:hypothetical protein GGI12_002925 [Dipsacomyces acuminosporus]
MDTEISERLFDSAASYLRHLSETISTLDDATYTQASTALPGSTIGKHARHILDHFNLLLAAAEAGSASEPRHETRYESVHYSHRERNTSAENDVASGRISIGQTVKRLLDLKQRRSPDLFSSIHIFDTLPDGREAEFASTLGRELWFCIHHLVHHNAIIASLLHEFGQDRPTDFAYAPSTIQAKEAARH